MRLWNMRSRRGSVARKWLSMSELRRAQGQSCLALERWRLLLSFRTGGTKRRSKGERKKQQRAREKAFAKARKEQEAQKRRDDRAIAREMKTARREEDRAAKKAWKQVELELRTQNKRPRGRPKKQWAPAELVIIEQPSNALEGAKQLRSRSGRAIRVSTAPVKLKLNGIIDKSWKGL
jgi:hypothetical protein